MNRNVVKVLQCARDLLADPNHWTQKDSARNAFGRSVDVKSPNACSFCMLGAVLHCGDDGDRKIVGDAMEVLRDALPSKELRLVTVFNDSIFRKHHEVLAVFDKAIKTAKEEKNG